MPTHDAPDEVAAALARLEAGLPGPEATAPDAWEPRTPREAVRAWVTALALKPGAHQSPGMTLLGGCFTRHARGAGWALDSMTANALGRCLRALGFTAASCGGVRGVLVTRDNARVLWAETPRKKQPGRKLPRRLVGPPRVRPPFYPLGPKARPLVDTLGRVWPNARVAAAALPRVNHQDIQACAKGRRVGVGGCLWRYLTPEEVALVPPMHVSGHVIAALAWGRTVTAHGATGVTPCVACEARRREGGPEGVGGGFPKPPVDGTQGGGPTHASPFVSEGPTHIPPPFSDG